MLVTNRARGARNCPTATQIRTAGALDDTW